MGSGPEAGRVLGVELTTADVARCGLRTVKVLVPGAIDINGHTRFPYLGSHRVQQVPRALGWPVVPEVERNRTPWPIS